MIAKRRTRKQRNWKSYLRFGNCRKCGRRRLIKARGLCASDYNMRWRKRHLIRCRECVARIHRHGRHRLCRSCSMRGDRNPMRMLATAIESAHQDA